MPLEATDLERAAGRACLPSSWATSGKLAWCSPPGLTLTSSGVKSSGKLGTLAPLSPASPHSPTPSLLSCSAAPSVSRIPVPNRSMPSTSSSPNGSFSFRWYLHSETSEGGKTGFQTEREAQRVGGGGREENIAHPIQLRSHIAADDHLHSICVQHIIIHCRTHCAKKTFFFKNAHSIT